MNRLRQGLEKNYETSKDLRLLNVLLAFEDSELEKIVSLVKGINLETGETVLVVKSEGDTPDSIEPIKKDYDTNSSTSDNVVIHERFFTGIEPMQGVEIKTPKVETVDLPTSSKNLVGDGKKANR
ncbi:hypothetical protein Adt_46214 [Abeliophyllum distichum]|uniref:Uncharacterized protein n=1 Tax=Abeliophyllum distichum TaxID=126358 RepID=A0ABD1P2C0_9LAMI